MPLVSIYGKSNSLRFRNIPKLISRRTPCSLGLKCPQRLMSIWSPAGSADSEGPEPKEGIAGVDLDVLDPSHALVLSLHPD